MIGCLKNLSSFIAIYDKDSNIIIESNTSLLHRIDGTVPVINILHKGSGFIYGTFSGTPFKMETIQVLDSGYHVVEVSLGHTKKWSQESDMVKITDLTSDGVWEWFPSVNYEYMSPRFWNILGYNQSDMVETPESWMGFLNPDDVASTTEMFAEHVKSRGKIPYIAQVRYTHKEGHEVNVLCRGSVVDWLPDGSPWRILGTHTDVTNIVKKDALDAKSIFISRMSHEIRSPICTILNECELFEGVDVRCITDACNQLMTITDDILTLGKTNSDGLVLYESEVSTLDILDNSMRRHRKEATKKNIKIRLSTGDLPHTLSLDLGKFNQVLDNLIQNSIKYSKRGKIIIDSEYDSDLSELSVSVSDNGFGIEDNIKASIFEEFFQGSSSMSGAGIGLSLCRKLARFMGGDVVIEETDTKKGTTMLFTCKCESVVKLAKSKSIRVLVVDDMSTNRLIIKRRLGNSGLDIGEIVEAMDGQEAIDIFKINKGLFDIILMDCLMPIIDGFSATLQIHKECDRLGIEPVPVVAVTASVSSELHEKCRLSGMKFVVIKPYSVEELSSSISACVNSKNFY